MSGAVWAVDAPGAADQPWVPGSPNSTDRAGRESDLPTMTALALPPWSRTTVHRCDVWMYSRPELEPEGDDAEISDACDPVVEDPCKIHRSRTHLGHDHLRLAGGFALRNAHSPARGERMNESRSHSSGP